ncbi:MAG: hypothetical protein KDA51_11295 [Planctomycetales bacterium]|nr:hypothetical protein [Planctomycetales bacterium]
MSNRSMNRQSHHRRGSMLTELMVAAGLLATAMGLVATCAVADQRLQRMQREHRLAVDELSNQLERLLALPPSEVDIGVQQLEPSDWITERLPEIQLTAQRHRDELGDRVELQLQWKRAGNPPPLVAVAWMNADEQTIEQPH